MSKLNIIKTYRVRKQASYDRAVNNFYKARENALDFILNSAGLSLGGVERPNVRTALKSDAVTCAVNSLSSSLANLPIIVKRTTKDTEEHSEKPEFDVVKHNWTKNETSTFALRRFWHYLFTDGIGGAVIRRDNNNAVREIEVISPDQISRGYVDGELIYTINDSKETFLRDNIIEVLWQPNHNTYNFRENQISTGNDFTSPIITGWQAIKLNLLIQLYQNKHFGSGGIPPIIFTNPEKSTEKELVRMTKDINQTIKAANRKNNLFITLPGHTEVHKIDTSAEKQQLAEIEIASVRRIARLYDLPPNELHEVSNSTYSNAEQAALNLTKNALLPWSNMLAKEITSRVFANRREYSLAFDMRHVLRADFKTLVDGLSRLIMSGAITPNDARRELGFPRIEDESADKLMAASGTMILEDMVRGMLEENNDVARNNLNGNNRIKALLK